MPLYRAEMSILSFSGNSVKNFAKRASPLLAVILSLVLFTLNGSTVDEQFKN
jgi:hypothetical protein